MSEARERIGLHPSVVGAAALELRARERHSEARGRVAPDVAVHREGALDLRAKERR
ncbi:MAG: hypothetical protein ACRCYQ_03350 [Nocardioides sp.]